MEGNHLPNLSGLGLVEAGADIGARPHDPAQSPMWPGQAAQDKWSQAFVQGVEGELRKGERGEPLIDQTKQRLIDFFNGTYNSSDRKLMSQLWTSVAFFYTLIQNNATFKPWANTITYKFKEEPYTKSDKFPDRAYVIKLFQDFFIQDKKLDMVFKRRGFDLRAFCEAIGFWPGGNAHADLFLSLYNAKLDELFSENKLALDKSNEYKEKIKLVHRELGFFNTLDKPAADKRKWVVQVLKEEEAYLSLQAARLRAEGNAYAEGWKKQAAALRQQVAEQKAVRRAAAKETETILKRLDTVASKEAKKQAAQIRKNIAAEDKKAQAMEVAMEAEAEQAMEVAMEATAAAEAAARFQEFELEQFQKERAETTKTVLEAMNMVNEYEIPYQLEQLEKR